MEEEEDRFLLSSLGVTSANPADIEQTILDEATKKLDNDESVEELEGSSLLLSSQSELLNKLRAVKFEIDAVASTVEQVEEDDAAVQSGSVLQNALAKDRLRSLRKRKNELEKELSGLHGQSGADRSDVLRNLVKGEPSRKRRLKEVRKPSKREGKKVKVVSFREDTDFDAVFDAASAGFVETERDELVRKGILTPFHKLEGFERRLQQPGPSNSLNLPEGEADNEDSSSIDRAVQSMSLAAKARPTTKLLDAQELPKLEATPVPFRRLRKLYKTNDSSDSDTKKSKAGKSKKKRPLPKRKWTKRISHEDSNLQESGMVDAIEN